jgi:hypothetical protein
MVEFVTANWEGIVAVVAAVLAVAAAVVKLTPSKKDDEVVDKIEDVVGPFLNKDKAAK